MFIRVVKGNELIFSLLIFYIHGAIQNGQDMDKMIIDFCREPKSVVEIMDNFKFKSRTSFKRNYLQKMLAEGTLKMTVPDKPSSRNQKYYS